MKKNSSSVRITKLPSAIKNGVYSTLAVLPGEDQAAYEKLHAELIEEFLPNGALEKDIVENIARLMWRKNNPATLRIATIGQSRIRAATDEILAEKYPEQVQRVTHQDSNEIVQTAQEKVRLESGDAFVALGAGVGLEMLERDLSLHERIDGMIDRCIKRLLMVRGIKPLSVPRTTEIPWDGN